MPTGPSGWRNVATCHRKLFLNLGTHPNIPPIPGLDEAEPPTHRGTRLDRLPGHLIVIGGGYVGLELAQTYRRFGSRGTAIDHGVRLLRRKDADVSQAVKAILEADGIEVLLSADVKQVRGRSGEVMAVVQAAMLGQLPYVMPFSPIRRWPRA